MLDSDDPVTTDLLGGLLELLADGGGWFHPGARLVARDGQKPGRVASVDLNADVVVVPVGVKGAGGQYADAVAAGAALGVAAHGVDDLQGPRGDHAVLDAVVQINAHHVGDVGEHEAHALVLAGVEPLGAVGRVEIHPALDVLGAQAVVVRVVRDLVVLLPGLVPHGLPWGPAAHVLELLRDVLRLEYLPDWWQVWCCLCHFYTQTYPNKK